MGRGCTNKSISLILLLSALSERVIKMCDCGSRSLDLSTPRNVSLTAFYKRSFAYHTVKNRMPVILTQIIDNLVRSKEQIRTDYGDVGFEDLKLVIGELSKLKYEVQTNKPCRKLNETAPDKVFYNKYITEQLGKEGNLTYFSAVWLFSECYMYRRIKEAFEETQKLKDYDPFRKQKREAYSQAVPLMGQLAKLLLQMLRSPEATESEFTSLLKINLWGNKCDLSLSNGQMVSSNVEDFFQTDALEPKILCNHSEKIWEAVKSGNMSTIDIVLDNSGYEVFTDLCLADYLTSKNLTSRVRIYVKSIPWFISDVMKPDFFWTLDQLLNSKDEFLRKVGSRWDGYVKRGTWSLIEDDFWTLPVDYAAMRDVKPALYSQLAEADLIVFKGDLNYRKLFGERNWDPTTPVEVALRNFHPAKLCTLRTIKADIVCGLEDGVAERIEAVDEKWMETGEYGLIQFSEKVVPL